MFQLAYSAFPDGCILITDGRLSAPHLIIYTHGVVIAMKILDPNLQDGVHEWRDGKRFVKEGDKLYLEGTSTLAGRYGVCRLFSLFPAYSVSVW